MTTDVRDPRPVTPAGILARRLADLARTAHEQPGTDSHLLSELDALAELAGGLEPYAERQTTPESPALAALAARTREHDWSAHDRQGLGLEQEMLSGHVEGRLLRILVGATRARRVLELGLFTGYSALAMAEALPGDGQLVACELDPDVAAFAREGFDDSPAGTRIDIRVGPAAETLTELAAEGEPFDLVFVDADKAGYTQYVDTVLSAGLLARDGLLCVDNTLMQGQPWTGSGTANGRAIARFNDTLHADDRVEQVLLPVRDGLTLARWARPGRGG
jgi:caffeoyl-CoA O-methyltransferase